MQGRGLGWPRTVHAVISRTVRLIGVDGDTKLGHYFWVHLTLDFHLFEGLHDLLLFSLSFLLHLLPLVHHSLFVLLDSAVDLVLLVDLTAQLVPHRLLASILSFQKALLFFAHLIVQFFLLLSAIPLMLKSLPHFDILSSAPVL